jgi:hypothetical protein
LDIADGHGRAAVPKDAVRVELRLAGELLRLGLQSRRDAVRRSQDEHQSRDVRLVPQVRPCRLSLQSQAVSDAWDAVRLVRREIDPARLDSGTGWDIDRVPLEDAA